MPIFLAICMPPTLPSRMIVVPRAALTYDGPHPSNFNNDPYLRRLNVLFRAELGARGLYLSYCLKIKDCPSHAALAERHLSAAKTLRTLILYHRGLPELEGFNLTSEIPLVTLQIAAFMPGRLSTATALRSCEGMERSLVAAYRKTLKVASERDRTILSDLLSSIRANLKALRQAP